MASQRMMNNQDLIRLKRKYEWNAGRLRPRELDLACVPCLILSLYLQYYHY